MLLHIPHSSASIPANADYTVPVEEINMHTDWLTDVLFEGQVRFVYPYSRFAFDMERLVDDPLEAVGRGILYTHLSNGERFRTVSPADIRIAKYVRAEWYNEMQREAESQSAMLDNVVVVDCHSFSAAQLGVSEDDVPDVCIGFNDDASRLPESVLHNIASAFHNAGYTTAFNRPYGNAIVVSDVENVYSVMLEINKRTYLTESLAISDEFENMKAAIDAALKVITDFEVGITAS